MTKPATRAVRTGIENDQHHGAIVPPIHLSTNYSFVGFNQKRQYDYGRSGNPTRDILAQALAELEQGAGCVVTSSGMAAINLVAQLLSPQDLLVIPHDCYGGSQRLFKALADKGAFKLAIVDQNDEQALAVYLEQNPRLIWIESPSNPLLRVVDIEKISASAKRVGALIAVDNTFLSPALQQPIKLGADLVVHSTTKYINGHSDVVGGAVIAQSPELLEQLQWWSNCLGLSGSSFDSYLTLRGLRTLVPRMTQHQASAEQILQVLLSHPAVSEVYHPSLETHPGHEIARRQQSGFGAMLSFELEGVNEVKTFLESLNLFSLAESLGGVESLVCHPGTMTHAAMSQDAQLAAGIAPGLVRLSVGLEAAEDLIQDLTQALDLVSQSTGESHTAQLSSVTSSHSEQAQIKLNPAFSAFW